MTAAAGAGRDWSSPSRVAFVRQVRPLVHSCDAPYRADHAGCLAHALHALDPTVQHREFLIPQSPSRVSEW